MTKALDLAQGKLKKQHKPTHSQETPTQTPNSNSNLLKAQPVKCTHVFICIVPILSILKPLLQKL